MSLKNLKNIFNLNLIIVLIIFFLDRISKEYVVNLNQKTQIPEIFSSKYYKNNWFSLFKIHQKKFYKIINKDYLIMYLLWKVNNDLKYIKKSEFKNKKYKDVLKYFFNNLI